MNSVKEDRPTKTPQERYLHKPFLGSSHSWVFKQLAELRKDARVLDIGPGSGNAAIFLRGLGLERIDAVEIDAATRRSLSTLYDRVEENVEALNGEQYDCLLMLDVIEHTPEPEAFFQSATRLLAPNGRVYLSVPNVAHWSVRIPLLFGFFEYTDRAILDRTHLQFFNRRRFMRLLHDSGLNLLQLGVALEPAEFVLPQPVWDNGAWRAFSRIRLLLAGALPGFFAYQLLACLEKR